MEIDNDYVEKIDNKIFPTTIIDAVKNRPKSNYRPKEKKRRPMSSSETAYK